MAADTAVRVSGIAAPKVKEGLIRTSIHIRRSRIPTTKDAAAKTLRLSILIHEIPTMLIANGKESRKPSDAMKWTGPEPAGNTPMRVRDAIAMMKGSINSCIDVSSTLRVYPMKKMSINTPVAIRPPLKMIAAAEPFSYIPRWLRSCWVQSNHGDIIIEAAIETNAITGARIPIW